MVDRVQIMREVKARDVCSGQVGVERLNHVSEALLPPPVLFGSKTLASRSDFQITGALNTLWRIGRGREILSKAKGYQKSTEQKMDSEKHVAVFSVAIERLLWQLF